MAKGDRADMLGPEVVGRVESEVAAALRRRPAHESRLAGALRVLAPHAAALRNAAAGAAELLVRRESFSRPLYVGVVRALSDAGDRRAPELLARAISADEAGGFATLSAACAVRDGSLAGPLARVAGSRHAHLAFAAEVARMARGESDGAHLAAIAPKIKESHRIALCVEVFVPLSRAGAPPLPPGIGSALAVLRDAERHLGRWLVLAEVSTRAADRTPLEEARLKAKNGPASARAAWSLVAWALAGESTAPSARPTVELVARLSDRPSADRDTTFLFRLAVARAPMVRPMLEGLAKSLPAADEAAVRAALFLVRDHGREDLAAPLESIARGSRRDETRGLAIAALWDAGRRQRALELAADAARSRSLTTVAWACLVKVAAASGFAGPVVDEPTFRRAQWGWLE
jgi:hypothetical protein